MATDLGKLIADRAAKRGSAAASDGEESDMEAPADEETSPGDEPKGENEAADNLVEILGLEGSKAEAFKAALEDYVKSCMEE